MTKHTDLNVQLLFQLCQSIGLSLKLLRNNYRFHPTVCNHVDTVGTHSCLQLVLEKGTVTVTFKLFNCNTFKLHYTRDARVILLNCEARSINREWHGTLADLLRIPRYSSMSWTLSALTGLMPVLTRQRCSLVASFLKHVNRFEHSMHQHKCYPSMILPSKTTRTHKQTVFTPYLWCPEGARARVYTLTRASSPFWRISFNFGVQLISSGYVVTYWLHILCFPKCVSCRFVHWIHKHFFLCQHFFPY